MERYIKWIEEHPGESVLIGGGGVLFLLWLFGYFSAPAASGASNLASAYYAAEAQQATVAGQIQMANITSAAQTAQTGLNDQTAQAIAITNAGAATTINGQNANAAQTINAAQVAGATQIASIQGQTYQALGSDQLQASVNNNATALAALQNNNATAVSINAANNITSQYNALIGSSIIPTELHLSGGQMTEWYTPSGAGYFGTEQQGVDINALISQGYSAGQAQSIAALQGVYGPASQSYAQQQTGGH
jgi:hypothetical protein